MSVTKGEDKPVKYPRAFRASQVMLLNMIDLLPYVRFDVDQCLPFAREVNPGLRIFRFRPLAALASWTGTPGCTSRCCPPCPCEFRGGYTPVSTCILQLPDVKECC